MGRFINADVVYDFDAGLQGFNLFIYCGNDPINRIDSSGADSDGITEGEDMLDKPLLEGGGACSGGKGGQGCGYTGYGHARGAADVRPPIGGNVGNGGKTSGLPANNSSMTADDLIDFMLRFIGSGYTEESPWRFVSADKMFQIRMGNDDLLGTHAGGPHVNFNLLVPKYQNVHVYIRD